MTSSLSSVVSNLVRASMGTSVPSTVTDEDLDRHVAELILKEAKKKAEKYGTQGIRAFLPGGGEGGSDSPAPRTNKRFLSSIIKTTEDHNKTVLRAQALAAQEQKRERDEQERRARRKRAEEAAEAERMRRGRNRRRGREESWERWEGRREGRERRERRTRDWERDWEEVAGRRKRERRRSKSRNVQKYALDDIDSDTPPHRSPVPSDIDSEPPRAKPKRRRTPSPSPSRSPSRSRSPSPAPKSKSKSKHHKSKHKHKRAKTSTAPSSQTPRNSPRPPSGSPPPLPSGPPPPLPPSPGPGPFPPPPPPLASRLPSKMDKYFEESYDPRLDVAPLAVPSVPKTGLINDAEYAGWDAMLELLRVRREDKEEKKRLERLGVGMVSDRGLPPPKTATAPGEVSVMEIQYKKRGSVREWDLGKEGLL